MPVNCSPTDQVQLFFSIGKTKTDAKFLLWVLSYTGNFFTGDSLFVVKKTTTTTSNTRPVKGCTEFDH